MTSVPTDIRAVARALVAPGTGILAIDESAGTCNKRFASLQIPETIEMRRAYRELLLTATGLGSYVSGAILYDETLAQRTAGGVPFLDVMDQAGILPGIKVDLGTTPLRSGSAEKVTEGLDGLAERAHAYRKRGARFAKWRAVVTIGAEIPSRGCLEANLQALARYARICQDADLVPIVEPEVLMDGDHSLERCDAVTEETLHVLFAALAAQRVALDAIILKPAMVIPGERAPHQVDVETVAAATVDCLRRTVPAAVAGIAFLSGGQSAVRATEHLAAINRSPLSKPWPLTFSYGRALQQPALDHWRGKPERVAEAQRRLIDRTRCNAAAARGTYEPSMETGAPTSRA